MGVVGGRGVSAPLKSNGCSSAHQPGWNGIQRWVQSKSPCLNNNIELEKRFFSFSRQISLLGGGGERERGGGGGGEQTDTERREKVVSLITTSV